MAWRVNIEKLLCFHWIIILCGCVSCDVHEKINQRGNKCESIKPSLRIIYILKTFTHIAGCQHGNINLVDGNSQNVGRVEICIDNQWGTVTDDGWSSNDAKVVCRQLGYSTDGEPWKQSKLKWKSKSLILSNLWPSRGSGYLQYSFWPRSWIHCLG